MSDKVQVGGGGLGCGTVLFLIFLVLKLTNTIQWSWWYITMPLWIGFAIFAAIVLIVFAVWLIGQIIVSCLK